MDLIIFLALIPFAVYGLVFLAGLVSLLFQSLTDGLSRSRHPPRVKKEIVNGRIDSKITDWLSNAIYYTSIVWWAYPLNKLCDVYDKVNKVGKVGIMCIIYLSLLISVL